MFARTMLTLLCCASLTAVSAARTLVENDYARIVTFDEPALSSDARYAAAVISRVDWNNDRSVSSLLIARAGNGSREFLTGRKGLSSPRFSPDGTQLAFLANDAGHDA